MKLLLLAGGERGEGELTALWDGAEEGKISVPLELHKKLLQIRAEHAAWAYETGFLKIGGRSLADRLRCGADLSMWWTSLIYERHPRMTPALYDIYKLRCLELLCAEHGVTALALAGGDARLAAVLGAFCQAAGLDFELLKKGRKAKTRFARRVYQAIPAPARALLRYGHWWFAVRRRLPYGGRQSGGAGGPKPALIATYFPNIDLEAAGRGRFRSRYWEKLHDLLNRQAREEGQFVRWLFIRFPHPALSLPQCIRLRDVFRKKREDGATFNYLEEYLSSGDLFAALWRWARLCVASLGMERASSRAFHFKGSKINFWAYARADWAESFRGWRALERSLQNLAFGRAARENGAQRFSLFPLENCPWERMLTTAARGVAANGPVFGAQHSSIRPTDFRYFDDPRTFANPECAVFQPDLFCGNGESACKQWLAFGMPKERLRQVEALRYLYLADRQSQPPNPASRLPPEPGEPLADSGRRGLLVLTSFFQGETGQLCETLAGAVKSGLLNGWNIVVKPHPYLPVRDLLQKLLGAKAAGLRFADGPIALALKPGVTALCANSTTAALEAALLNLPLMVMQALDDFDLCPIQDVPDLARIAGLADLKKAMPGLAPVALPAGYLNLNPALLAWRALLGLKEPQKNSNMAVDIS